MATYEELLERSKLAQAKENRLYRKYIAAKEAARVAAADAKAAEFPVEPTNAGTVIVFKKWFSDIRQYDFAAIKSNTGRWSVTGRGGLTEITWRQVMDYVVKDEADRQRALASLRLCASPMALPRCF